MIAACLQGLGVKLLRDFPSGIELSESSPQRSFCSSHELFNTFRHLPTALSASSIPFFTMREQVFSIPEGSRPRRSQDRLWVFDAKAGKLLGHMTDISLEGDCATDLNPDL